MHMWSVSNILKPFLGSVLLRFARMFEIQWARISMCGKKDRKEKTGLAKISKNVSIYQELYFFYFFIFNVSDPMNIYIKEEY